MSRRLRVLLWYMRPCPSLQGLGSHATAFGKKGGAGTIEPFKMNNLSVLESCASDVQRLCVFFAPQDKTQNLHFTSGGQT